MKKISIRPEREYLREIVSKMQDGQYAVPAFQRDLVWSTTQIIDLFDSITKGYPIGTNPKDMAEFFRRIGWHVESSVDGIGFDSYEAFAGFVQKELKAGHPIMVENVEWGGHWRVIIGYDNMGTETTLDDVLIFMDSYDTSDHLQDGYTVGNGWRFFAMWFDHSMLPEDQRNQPFILAYPVR